MKKIINIVILIGVVFAIARGVAYTILWIGQHNAGILAWIVLLVLIAIGITISDRVDHARRGAPPKKRRRIW